MHRVYRPGGLSEFIDRGVVSYPDPDFHSSGWITSPLRDSTRFFAVNLNFCGIVK